MVRERQGTFFRSGFDTIAVVSLQYGKNGLQVIQTTPLFKSKSPFDVSPDSQRILIFKHAENPKAPSITLLPDWPSLLSKK